MKGGIKKGALLSKSPHGVGFFWKGGF